MAPKPTSRLDEARERLAESVSEMDEWDVKLQSLPDDAKPEEIDFHRDAFNASAAVHKRWVETVDRLHAIDDARASTIARQPSDDGDDEPAEARRLPAGERTVKREEKTYTQKSAASGRSFFIDLINAQRGDGEASERLQRHTREMAIEQRALSTTVTEGGNFVPPAYLGEMFAGFPRAGRPFADAVPSQPLMASGMNITIPRITTGSEVEIQETENSSLKETDLVEALLTVRINTIAGKQTISQQLFDRSEPGIDSILFNDLRAAYDQKLDYQLLNGAGTSNHHRGIRAVSGKIDVTWTEGSPTAALAVPKVYDAIQRVASQRYMEADTIVMHPRRAAWLASNLSSTVPLFQLGSLNQASGSQSNGFVGNIAGLNVVIDANVRTTDGVATNQDEVYVVRTQDMMLWEGPIQARVMPGDDLDVKIQLFGYSAFASGRHPKSIAVIAGTGLVSPSF